MPYAQPNSTTLDLRLQNALNKGAILLDVRTHCEHAGYHLQGTLNIPYDEIDRFKDFISTWEKPVVTFSTYGRRSELAQRKLRAMGVEVLNAHTINNVSKAMEING